MHQRCSCSNAVATATTSHSNQVKRVKRRAGGEHRMIEVDHLSKYYGPVIAIRDLSFSVEKGEILGFLGPNGAGKTTTMRILTGFMAASSGRAMVAGYDVFAQALEVRQRVGYLPENVPLYKEMTVSGYLHFVAEVSMTCDRVVIINSGQVAAIDTPDNLTERTQPYRSIHLEVQGPEEAVLARLQGLPGVLTVAKNGANPSGASVYTLSTTKE